MIEAAVMIQHVLLSRRLSVTGLWASFRTMLVKDRSAATRVLY